MCHFLLLLPLLALPLFWIFPLSVALPAYGTAAGLSAATYWYAIKAMKRPIQNGTQSMIGEIGEVVECGNEETLIKLHSEIWRAIHDELSLQTGDRVEVVGVEHRTLRVQQPLLKAFFTNEKRCV